MKETTGYLTKDGLFFENIEHAQYSEALHDLKLAIHNSIEGETVDIIKFISTIELHHEEVIAFAQAYKNVKDLSQNEAENEAS